MAEKRKVNVELYGGKPLFGGREKPLVADEIYCECPTRCQFLENDTCVCCRAALALNHCPYGSVNRIKGYTSKAKKYGEFRSKYRSDEVFSRLSYPRDVFLRIVGDYAFVHLPGAECSYLEEPDAGVLLSGQKLVGATGRLRFGDPGLFTAACWVPKDELRPEDIAYMASLVPRTWMGNGAIEGYQEKTVPAFIDDIRNFWPEMYAELKKGYPELCDKQVDYRGRKAYLKTLKEGIAVKDCHGNAFTFDGDKLVCDDYSDSLAGPAGAKARHAVLSIPVGDDTVVEVADNDWVVAGKTRFA